MTMPPSAEPTLWELHRAVSQLREARFAQVAKRHKRSDDKKAVARRLPPLDSTAQRLYRRPVTLAEQEARAERDAADRWEDEGGHCPAAGTLHPAVGPVTATPDPINRQTR